MASKTHNIPVTLSGDWEDEGNGRECAYCGEPIWLRQFSVSIQMPTLGDITVPLLTYCQACGEVLEGTKIFQQ